MRRLITLTSAGRNRLIVICRELPRTRDVGLGRKTVPHKTYEDSPYHAPSPCHLLGLPIAWPKPRSYHCQGHTPPLPPIRNVFGIGGGPCPDRAKQAAGQPGRVTPMRYKSGRGNGGHPARFLLQATRVRSWVNLASVFTAMAHTKPSNSRPTAVTIGGLSFPLAARFL